MKKVTNPYEDLAGAIILQAVKDYRMAYPVMGQLVKNGCRRPVLVEDRKSSSTVTSGKKAPPVRGAPPARRQIRYK